MSKAGVRGIREVVEEKSREIVKKYLASIEQDITKAYNDLTSRVDRLRETIR